MDTVTWRRKLASSRLAGAAAFPQRARVVGAHDLTVLRNSARWLVHSHEHTNFTYDLTPLNQAHLAWFVANLLARPVAEVRSYIDELLFDEALADHIAAATAASDRRRIADAIPRFGRRAGWYAMVRVVQPHHVVETGTDKGLGSLALAAALLRNGHGRLTTIDVNPAAGYLVGGIWASVIDYRQGNSHDVLPALDQPVDLFLHDSLHSPAHERREYDLVTPLLTQDALVLSDTAEDKATLMDWAEEHGRRFHFFKEQPADHWFPGGGIGVASAH